MDRRPAVWFVLRFALLSAVLLGIYYYPYSDSSPIQPWIDGFLDRYAASAGWVLHWLEPQVRVVGTSIIGRYSLRIVKTCDAMDVTILLTSAILAWPSPWRRKLIGALAGILLLYVLNVLRICSLYGIGIMYPSFFETAHVDVWPAIILVASVSFFLVTTTRGTSVRAEVGREPG
jgi:exosortase/archaeosortase family protein